MDARNHLFPTDEEILEADQKWKSDVDKKLDSLLSFHETYGPLLVMLTERETRRAAVQKAIIEKSIAALVYMAIAAVCTIIWTGTKEEVRLLVEAWGNTKKP